MKKIKWENIFLIVYTILMIISTIDHLIKNGFYFGIIVEIIVYIMGGIIYRYMIKAIRKGEIIMYKVYVTLETININTLEKEYKSILIDTFDTLEEASNFIEDKQGYTIVY